MKQKLFVAILASTLVLGITACGTDSPGKTDSANGKNNSQTTVENEGSPNKRAERPEAEIDAPYTVEKKVRKLGDKEWSEVVDAEIGDQVEFQIEYNNTSTETQNDVMIRDVLPGNLKYVPGTTKLYNANHLNWASVTPDGDIVTRGINIGSYVGSADGQNGGNAFVRFTAEVVDNGLDCGENFIYNWGRASYGGTVNESSSVVIVQKPEQK